MGKNEWENKQVNKISMKTLVLTFSKLTFKKEQLLKYHVQYPLFSQKPNFDLTIFEYSHQNSSYLMIGLPYALATNHVHLSNIFETIKKIDF